VMDCDLTAADDPTATKRLRPARVGKKKTRRR